MVFQTKKDFETTDSIGIELINSLIYQLDGESKISSENGFKYEFHSPLLN